MRSILQNAPSTGNPTIKITSDAPGWFDCYVRWIDGKDPSDNKEWKKGVFFFREETPPPSPWDYHYLDNEHIRDYWIKKFDCLKCSSKRTKAFCFSCSPLSTLKETTPMIDVLASSPAIVKDHTSVDTETFGALKESYDYIHNLFWQMDKLFSFMRDAMERHGGQKHIVGSCSKCIDEQREWLEANHKGTWQEKASEKGCCSVCVARAYKALKDMPKEIVIEKKTESPEITSSGSALLN